MLIDSHCHLDLDIFEDDRLEILQRCQQKNIQHIIVPAIKRARWDKLINLCQTHPMLSPALGLHPYFIDEHQYSDLDDLQHYVTNASVIAIGEIGLDLHRGDLDLERQIHFFREQLNLAVAHKLPVIVHVRKAHDLVINTLKQHELSGGIIHAYNGSLQQAHSYLDMNFKLGFGGMLTYERSNKLRRLAAQLPLDAIVLETDAPDMTGAAHHGQRNSPEYIDECFASLAEIRGQPLEVIAETTSQNVLHALPRLAQAITSNTHN